MATRWHTTCSASFPPCMKNTSKPGFGLSNEVVGLQTLLSYLLCLMVSMVPLLPLCSLRNPSEAAQHDGSNGIIPFKAVQTWLGPTAEYQVWSNVHLAVAV